MRTTTSTSTKQSVSFRWDANLVKSLKEMAKRQNRSFSSFTETILAQSVNAIEEDDRIPNEVTLAAIEEARSGKELETLDLEHFDEFVKSL